ncbi:Acyl-[acyl-carrier-protein] desaturase, chloroplastic [Morella rubra]|uniref:Acyl-[acyl-carrier-protein] desaturase, chloroplastic n=1 Tax=Morella rubra TaxID=262757 RepID=A0A6A1VYU2_9ROSI|nr:Acyl-[acyl-carrier-protein] desaturase, chloroplastic [Morella rubra]
MAMPASTMPPEKVEIFKSMEDWARNNVITYLKPVEKSWQPQEFMPDPTSDGFFEQVKELRERSKEVPDDYFVVLVGDMITEEALPTYQARINGLEIFRDQTGVDDTPWSIWGRGWSAEENRHGDLLNRCCLSAWGVHGRDYMGVYTHLVAKWNVEKLTGLSSEGREAQDYVCGLVKKMKRLEERGMAKAEVAPGIPFSWLCGREV